MSEEPRMRDLYQEYLAGRVTFDHLVETANRFLERWEADRAPTEAEAPRPQPSEPSL